MANPHIDGLWLRVVLLQRIYQAHKYPVELGRIFFDYKRVMFIYNQPVDKFILIPTRSIDKDDR